MRFIRFADTLLNLGQVIYFHNEIEGEIGPTIYAYLNGPFPVRHEYFNDTEAMQARFDQLAGYLVDDLHARSQPEPVSRGRVMTAGEAAKLPDIVGKRVAFVVHDAIQNSDGPISIVLDKSNDHHFVLYKNNVIEVLD